MGEIYREPDTVGTAVVWLSRPCWLSRLPRPPLADLLFLLLVLPHFRSCYFLSSFFVAPVARRVIP